MPPILLVKTGDTYPQIKAVHGDFEDMIAACLPEGSPEIMVYDARVQQGFPPLSDFCGVIITGSHSMVTDEAPWSEGLLAFIREMYQTQIPVLGICYGHQLIAKAMGGQVDYRQQGIQAGTVSVALTEAAHEDPIFSQLPSTFSVNVGHSQAVMTPPQDASLLACNQQEPHGAIRIGKMMWGVQFHPEFTQAIMRQYIELSQEVMVSAGLDPAELMAQSEETPECSELIGRFADFAVSRGL